MSLLKLC